MAMTMQEFLVLADADLDEIWFEEEPELPEQYSQYMNIVSQEDLYKRDAKLAGFGPMSEIPEGGDVLFDVAIPPITRRYDLVKRGGGYKITDKLWKFDRYGEVRNFERSLMRADRDDSERFFNAVWNNATNTDISAGFDGLSLSNTAHTRMDGGAVISNRLTVLTALSLTAFEDAIIAFRTLVDDRGRPYRSDPQILLISPELILTAEEILGSALRPNTANNATNAVRMFNIQSTENFYLTSGTFWALIGTRHDVNALWNERPGTDSEIDFDSDTIKRKVTKWMGRGHGEWRGVFQGNS